MTGPAGPATELAAQLRGGLRDFLHAHGADPVLPEGDGADALWKRLCTELDVCALLVPECHGGLQLGPPELAAVAGELGRVLDGGPFLPSAVSATTALAALSDEPGVAPLLQDLGSGVRTAALVHDPFVPGGPPVVITPGSTLTGRAGPFAVPPRPDVLVVAVRGAGPGPALAILDARAAGVALEHPRSLDLSRPASRVVLDAAPAQVIDGPRAAAALHAASTATAVAVGAEAVAVAAHALEMTVTYLGTRRQFGRVVGSFQAVKHQLADLAVTVESARSALELALRAGSDPVRARLGAHALLAVAGDAAVTVTTECLQLHGGIGFTWEHPMHFLLRRAHTCAALFGTPAQHRRALHDLLEETGPPAPQTPPGGLS